MPSGIYKHKKGRILTKKSIKKIKISLKKYYKTLKGIQAKQKLCRRTDKNNPRYIDGRWLKKHYCIDCKTVPICYANFLYGSQKCRNCAMKDKKTGGRRIYYKDISMRSSYETKFAFFLDCSRIKWEYEPKAFDLGNTIYIPDFYLSEFDTYIEVKGYWRKDAKKKFNLFKNKYPELRIKIFNENKLLQLGVL